MKQHITPLDLNDLTGAQKETLRSSWLPEKNDLAVAFICKNVETEEYDEIAFVVGEIKITEKMLHSHMVLRRLRLVDEPEIEDEDEETQNVPKSNVVDFPGKQNNGDDESEDEFAGEEEAFMPYIEPEQYFNIEDCLPLLSIGQMLGILRKSKIGQNGMELFLPPDSSKIFDRRLYTLSDNEGEAFENEELCDLLWDALKTVL